MLRQATLALPGSPPTQFIEGGAAWTHSSRMANAPGEKADRWGIYVGLCAPTFTALGNAIQTAEGSD